jgi:hypothetical protein
VGTVRGTVAPRQDTDPHRGSVVRDVLYKAQ